MSSWLQHLNPEQREAVTTVDGPLLVLAGAGSGKTRVITHRIAHMIDDHGVPPGSILAVTFTNKAAAEMRERLRQMIGGHARDVTLSTFHALGLQMLRKEAARGKRRQRFAIYDTGDQLSCLRDVCRRVRLDQSLDLGAILTRISAYKNAFLDPGQLPPSDDPYDQAAALLYPGYLEQLEAYAAVDFDDLVCRPTRLLERSAACRERWAARFRRVLVDEYQDTNGAQLRLLRAIAGEHRNLCVVGDDDQSIYGWRGAQVQNILSFERHFPGARVVYLERNYRSVGSVLTLANAVIARNPARHDKKLVPQRGPGEPVRMVVTSDGDAEATWVASFLREAIHGRGRRPRDIAVLYRSNLLSRELETALRAEGIAYRVLGGTAFYDSREVKDLLAYLRVCAYPHDEISLRRILNVPPRGIGLRTVAKLGAWAEDNGTSFAAALRAAPQVLGRGDRATAAVEEFNALVERYRRRMGDGRQIGVALAALVDELAFPEAVRRGTTSPAAVDRRLAHMRGLVDSVRAYCDRAPRPGLNDFLSRVALTSSDADSADERGDLVTLSTLHGAKGLEFPLVVMVGLEEGYLPHERVVNPHQNDMDLTDIAEERRLCYVGITRAMEELVLTRCRERMMRGRPQPRTPSRFLDELPAELLVEEDLSAEPDADEVHAMLDDLLARLES